MVLAPTQGNRVNVAVKGLWKPVKVLQSNTESEQAKVNLRFS